MNAMKKRIGVLNVQGAVSEHAHSLRRLNAEPVLVKTPEDLSGISGLVIPGGESTTIGRLIRQYGLKSGILERAGEGMPIFGTCAGLIILASRIEGQEDTHLGLMDIAVDRNSFGRQRESFETFLPVPEIGDPDFPAVFIRAPHISAAGPSVRVMATYKGRVVAARQDHYLVTAFHPELTDDLRLHQYFLGMVANRPA